MAAEKRTATSTTTSTASMPEPLKPPSRLSMVSFSSGTTLHQVPILEELPASHVADDSVRDALWGDEPQASTGLEYIETHALRMRARVRREDPHTAYIPLRSKSLDVRLFKVATLVAATPLEHERCDFRGVTRVPGSLETVLGLLASEDARESYWVALNTQRGLLVHSLVATRRLTGGAPYPRWNQRYSAVKLAKHAPPVECCVSEYAAYDAVEEESEDEAMAMRRTRLQSQDLVAPDGAPLRSAFVYRRSIDQRLFNMDDVEHKLRAHGEHCERLYIQDLLYEISETTERHICKVVLTCSVYLTTDTPTSDDLQDDKVAKSRRHAFREFCTHSLLSLRQVLSNQWGEHMVSAGIVSKPRSLSRSRVAGQPAHCGVCSVAFSLLKKRHVCHACALVVCSRCCTKQEQQGSSLLSVLQPRSANLSASSNAHDLNSRRATRECILCSQFGADGDAARVSVSIRRHFTSSTVLDSARSLVTLASDLDETLSDSGDNQEIEVESDCGEEEEVQVVHSVEDLDPQLTRHSNQSQEAMPIKPRNLRVRASTEDHTITTAWREPEPELLLPLPPTQQPRHQPMRRFKQRCESVHLPRPSSSGGGLVLLTDIDTLSLTGSFRLDKDGKSSRRGSGGSDAGSNLGSSFVRASPPLPPGVRRPVRSVSEDTTRMPTPPVETPLDKDKGDEGLLDDLANFNLQLL